MPRGNFNTHPTLVLTRATMSQHLPVDHLLHAHYYSTWVSSMLIILHIFRNFEILKKNSEILFLKENK